MKKTDLNCVKVEREGWMESGKGRGEKEEEKRGKKVD